jgi:uncharacterized protein
VVASAGNRWFLDTAYALALASSSDAWHERALQLADEVEELGLGLVTSEAILLEIGNAMAKTPDRVFGVRLLERLQLDPTIHVVPLTSELFKEAFQLYRSRRDKEWGLIDCTSFVIMHQLGLQGALTADRHFEQAGFRALMRESS